MVYGNESPIAPSSAYREPFTGDEEIRVLGKLIGWRRSDGVYLTPAQHDAALAENIRTHSVTTIGTPKRGFWDKAEDFARHVSDEYLDFENPGKIATHLFFKNEIITTGMEFAESEANRGATGWVGAVGAVSESMDRNPGANALMAVGGGLAWMTGGLTLPLLTMGGKTVLGDAAKSVQAKADVDAKARANASQSAPKVNPPPASAPMEMDFLTQIWNWILDLLASLGLDYRTPSTAPPPPPTANATPPGLTPTSTGSGRLGLK